MNQTVQQQFMYLFERVGEPLYFGPRGQNNTYYSVPIDNLDAKTQHAANEYRRNMVSGGSTVAVKAPAQRPNLSPISAACPKNSLFSYFIPKHRNAAFDLKRILMNQSTMDDFMAMACTCRDSEMINPRLWIYAFASSALQRPDLKGFRMPAFWEIAPDQFVSPTTIRMAQRQAILPEQDRALIIVERNFTGDDSNPENRLAYFREDVGINSHHWHWHLIYPTEAPRTGPGSRNRKGELFYYMHHSIMARYDAERLANGLQRTVPWSDFSQAVAEGYFPKLYNTNSGMIWGSRQERTVVSSVIRTEFSVEVEDMRRWGTRIQEAVDTRIIIGTNGQTQMLTPETGIDVLGDIVEAADITPNSQFYGNYHNMGHILIAFSHDPVFRHRENMGVMGDNTTAMRDPAFFRWHKHIDDIFDKYKGTLPPYTIEQLTWAGIRVTDISLQTPNRERNTLTTNWMQSDIDLARGLDFSRTNMNNLGPVWARITHLNHEAFSYRIVVQNGGRQAVNGTVRIFMAPRLNERQARFDMASQRLFYFEMDKFTTNLRPGENVIERSSTDSSVTIQWEQSFRDLERDVSAPPATRAVCGCGWPQHMLVPKGTTSGMLFDLYVIVTNGALDQVARRNAQTQGQRENCRDSVSYCGILDELYPDARPMGFPFDRFPRLANSRPLANIDAFVQDVPNSRTTQIRVVHRDVTFVRPGGAPTGMSTVNAGSAPGSPTNSRPTTPTNMSRPATPTQPDRSSAGGRGRPGGGARGRPGSPSGGRREPAWNSPSGIPSQFPGRGPPGWSPPGSRDSSPPGGFRRPGRPGGNFGWNQGRGYGWGGG